jgi:hypothetical protein
VVGDVVVVVRPFGLAFVSEGDGGGCGGGDVVASARKHERGR